MISLCRIAFIDWVLYFCSGYPFVECLLRPVPASEAQFWVYNTAWVTEWVYHIQIWKYCRVFRFFWIQMIEWMNGVWIWWLLMNLNIPFLNETLKYLYIIWLREQYKARGTWCFWLPLVASSIREIVHPGNYQKLKHMFIQRFILWKCVHVYSMWGCMCVYFSFSSKPRICYNR